MTEYQMQAIERLARVCEASLVLADFYAQRGRLAEAAREYQAAEDLSALAFKRARA